MKVPSFRTRPLALAAAALTLAAALPAPAQPGAARTGIGGQVLDAASSLPLDGATVVLAPARDGAAGVLPPAASSAFLSRARQVVTREDGAYHFPDVPPGAWLLRVTRLGYRAATIEVQHPGADEARVSVGLSVVPVRLEALAVSAPPEPFASADGDSSALAAARIAAARERQRRYLSTDVRELTGADVREAGTLAETDLFRALQRLPGVAMRSDISAEPWTRGARWDLTRVVYDGMPLFSAFHAYGLMSGVSPDAIGAAYFHPSGAPTRLGETGAAVLELDSRVGAGDESGGVRGSGEISLLSGRLALDGRSRGGRARWMISARRSYLDALANGSTYLLGSRPGDGYEMFFGDRAGRLELDVGRTSTLEVSLLATTDHLASRGRHVDMGSRLMEDERNRLGLVALRSRWRGLRVRHALGVSGYDANVDRTETNPFSEYYRGFEPPAQGSVRYIAFKGEVGRDGADGSRGWTVGYDFVHQSAQSYGLALQEFLGDTARVWERRDDAFDLTSLWAERRWRPASRLTFETGLRLDRRFDVPSGSTQIAPRLAARLALDPRTTVSATVARSHQYAQALVPAEFGRRLPVSTSYRWQLADGRPNATRYQIVGDDGLGDLFPVDEPETPPLRTDVATLGAERWVGGWLLGSSAYVRRTTGLVTPDPTPGFIADRGLFVIGRERAHGVELSARRLAGRVTGSLAYSYGVATTEAAGLVFPSSQDRRHVLDATLLARLSRRISAGAAASVATGSPFTRTDEARLRYDSLYGQVLDRGWVAHEPNALRRPAFASVDLFGEYAFRLFAADATAYFQVLNATGRRNPGQYQGFVPRCPAGGECVERDRFREGVPRLPTIGLRLRF